MIMDSGTRKISAVASGLQSHSALIAALVLALALRSIWIAFVDVEPVSDSLAYDILARTLADHGVYGFEPDSPSAYWAVGTSAFIAAIYMIFGNDYTGVVAANLLASLMMIFFTYRITDELAGQTAAAAAAFVLAAWPNLIYFTTVISSELFFLFLLSGGLLYWQRAQRGGLLNLFACGVFWALACYVRPIVILLPFVLSISALACGLRPFFSSFGRASIVLCIVLLAVSPWSARNYAHFGSFVLVSTNFGPNFWMGNNPETTGTYMELPDRIAELSETERSKVLLSQALAYIEDEPAAFVSRTLRKLVILHDRETIGVAWNEPVLTALVGKVGLSSLKVVATLYWYAVLVAALAGAALSIVSGRIAGLLHPAILGWGYFGAVHAIIVAGDRYHMPSVPFLAILFGICLARSLETRIVPRRKAHAGAPAW